MHVGSEVIRRLLCAIVAAGLVTGCAASRPKVARPIAPKHATPPRGELFEPADLQTIARNLPAGYGLLPTSPCSRRLCLKSELDEAK